MPRDPELFAHLEWIGFVQPVGLVVSPPALVNAQAHPNKNIIPEHQRFLASVADVKIAGRDDDVKAITDFPGFVRDVLGWEPGDLLGGPGAKPMPAEFEVVLPEYNETLWPTYVVKEFTKVAGAGDSYIMLVQVLPAGTDLDEAGPDDHHWQAAPQAKFERLLRETKLPIGLLTNGTHLRLVYAPRGETSGHLTFPVREMTQVDGRPMFAAMHMLLGADRLFVVPEKQRLPNILAESRKYQNLVSTLLAEQVLASLYELVRGFQAADDYRKGELLKQILEHEPDQVYAGLLTVLLRLVFLLYAEDRGLVSNDPVYINHYSVTGLFDRLRADASRFPDTMDQRYGAWGQLLVLFRMIHDGAGHGALHLPARHGYLFNPDRYSFLEGRAKPTDGGPWDIPMVPDGTVFRVLQNLLILDGERISYRSLDVEQIGSVYETIMGFRMEKATGRSIAIKPTKRHGAPATISLEDLLAVKPAERGKWLKEHTDQALTGQAATALKDAKTIDELMAGLERKIAKSVTPNIVPANAMILQPSDERRRSGSHYTPRSLTEPIVRKALEPILKQLGEKPRPEQILDLKVCDPAMGSAAFLVEACRQLGDALVTAWSTHDCVPQIPPDEDAILHARRLVAQRCLYGVDKNPLAVDLAKLSLWLATLAKDHPFTFLDHALRCGDSLVGLSREQIAGFHWKPKKTDPLFRNRIAERMQAATAARRDILTAGDEVPHALKQQKLAVADEALNLVRLAGDLAVSAFFHAAKDKDREQRLHALFQDLDGWLTTGNYEKHRKPLAAAVAELHNAEHPLHPFHWEIEFPEVFDRENGGFDAIVGNPPFLGGTRISTSLGDSYLAWLKTAHPESHGNADLVAHFFRRTFALIRTGGTFGLIATNTIAQGDTRSTGLRWICKHHGEIYRARRRLKWPGQAAVVVSVVHVEREPQIAAQARSSPTPLLEAQANRFDLDGKAVPIITAYLFHAGGHDDPLRLDFNGGKSFTGCKIYGQGFSFDDSDALASPIAEMHDLVNRHARNAELIFPYIGGEEINESPKHEHHRYVINFGTMSEEQARKWPDLMRTVEEKVKPERMKLRDTSDGVRLKQLWWLYGRSRPEMTAAVKGLERLLVCSQTSKYLSFAFMSTNMVFSHKVVIIPSDSMSFFGFLQSRVHQEWADFMGSTMKDDPVYTPSDCFETFPFPPNFETDPRLESAGKDYYEFRAKLMVANNEGLTKTYNRFHDPNEPSAEIKKLRELHAAMDRAVLDAYGWQDLKPTWEFLLDYEEEDDEDEEDTGGSRPSARRKKKPWRYRWPDEFRDEVLARLLELNKQRAEEERLSGAAGEAKEKKTAKGGKGKKADTVGKTGKSVKHGPAGKQLFE